MSALFTPITVYYGVRVLLISDNKIASSYLRRLISHAGSEVTVVRTLIDAMQAAHLHDLAVMEINLENTTPERTNAAMEAMTIPVLPISAYSEKRVDEFEQALLKLKAGGTASDYVALIEELLGEKVT